MLGFFLIVIKFFNKIIVINVLLFRFLVLENVLVR